jgi:hypothetical protein
MSFYSSPWGTPREGWGCSGASFLYYSLYTPMAFLAPFYQRDTRLSWMIDSRLVRRLGTIFLCCVFLSLFAHSSLPCVPEAVSGKVIDLWASSARCVRPPVSCREGGFSTVLEVAICATITFLLMD